MCKETTRFFVCILKKVHISERRRPTSAYSECFDGFLDGHAVVFLVFFCIPTNHTDELLVRHTVELELLAVQTAELLRRTVCALGVLLQPQGVGHVPQRQITRRLLSRRKRLIAHRARLEVTLPPPLPQTRRTEAVAAQQDHGVVEYVAAHRAAAVPLRLPFGRRRARSHVVDSSRGSGTTFTFTHSLTQKFQQLLGPITLQRNTHKYRVA